MDNGGELSLNLNLSTDTAGGGNSKKAKIYGDRRSRVKQRKQLKRENQDNRNNSQSRDGETGSPKKRQYNQNEGGNDDDGGQGKKRKTEGVISSLFRKNPEIPEIASASVETLKENVFTGRTFADLPIHPFLVSNLQEKQGFKEMTEVQKRAIPVLLQRKDALVKSQTGSGKTLAYAVPIIQSLQSRKLKVKRDDGPYALVIVPTRELALQSYDIFLKLLRTFIWIVPGCLMGGEKKKAEKSRLRKGMNILIATPGRLIDHIKTTNVLSLARIQWLVIDEADRLLELGYERDIAQILNALKSQCPDPPQTVLLSATLSEGVERLSSITLNDPEHIDMTTDINSTSQTSSLSATETHDSNIKTDSFSVPSQLRQHFILTPCKLRLVTLAAFILWKCKYSIPGHKMVVFMSTQDSVEFHYRLYNELFGPKAKKTKDMSQRLWAIAHGQSKQEEEEEEEEEEDVGDSSDDGEEEEEESSGSKGGKNKKVLKIFQLYGDMEQKARTKTFAEFGEATSGVLLCTDVAARGLDLPHVDWIIQYTSPGSTVDYIHRVGRTARAGSKGQSLLFLMPSEAGYIQELNNKKISLSQLQSSTIFQQLLANIDDLPSSETENSSRQRPHTHEEAATYLQDRFEECVLRNKLIHGLAGKGFQSFVRAYATYSKEVKEYFKVSELHLGHVAKSFALREAPTKVHGVASKVPNKKKMRKEIGKPVKRPLSFKQATLSEYSSGLDGIKATNPSGKQFGKGKTKKKWKK